MIWLSRRQRWVLALVLACGAVYGRALGYGFVAYDDDLYVYDNAMVLRGLSWESTRWAFDGPHIGHYHPLTWLSHLTDVSLFGLDARGHHATNLALHAVNTVLLLLLLDGATGRTHRAGVAALLFAIHPIHVEPVVWVSSRKDLLSTLFFLLALIAHTHHARAPNLRRYAGVVAAYVGGLLCKPMVITLPILLLVLDYWPLRRPPFGVGDGGAGRGVAGRTALRKGLLLVAEKAPLLALGAISARVTIASAAEQGVMDEQNLSLLIRIQNSLVSYVVYLRSLVLPVDLSVQHDRFWSAPPTKELAWAMAILGVISAAAILGRRSHAYLAASWVFFLVSFLPVIGLLQYGGHSLADRYAYLPSIGACIAAAWGAAELASRSASGPRMLRLLGPLLTLVFGLLAALQVGYWRSSEALFRHGLELEPGSPRLHNLLGVELAKRGDLEEATWHYTRALELFPTYTKPLNNLGVMHLRKGDLPAAMETFQRLLRAAPEDPKGHANLALALSGMGRAQEAEAHYRVAIRIAPGYAPAREGLARLLLSLGRADEARTDVDLR